MPCAWSIPTCSVLTPRGRVDPAPPGASHPLIEPTRPQSSRRTTHGHNPMWLSHFCCSLSHFDTTSAIFQVSASHFATLLLQCSYILENSVILRCYSAQPFLLPCSAIFAILLSHLMSLLHFCSIILWSYQYFTTPNSIILLQWTQTLSRFRRSFCCNELSYFAIVLNHFMMLSSILWRIREGDQRGWMRANQNFSQELGLYSGVNPMSLSSNLTKTA
jgi:hypothetical protein